MTKNTTNNRQEWQKQNHLLDYWIKWPSVSRDVSPTEHLLKI